MDGEFLTQETTGMVRAIGGGNFLILATSQPAALAAAEVAVAAMKKSPILLCRFRAVWCALVQKWAVNIQKCSPRPMMRFAQP